MGVRHLVLATLLASSDPASHDTVEARSQSVVVYLHNGDRITGAWFYEKPGVDLYLNTAWGDLIINRYAVERMETPSPSSLPAP